MRLPPDAGFRMDEPALIQAAVRGDLQAFNRLVLAYQDMLYAQAYRMIGEPDAAEDATQDAFIAAYRNLGSYRGGSFKAWLLRIVTNLCYDELRKRKRRPTTPLEPLDNDEEEIESPRWMIDPGATPEETAERAELARALQHCLDDLPPEFRAMVILVDVQGMDYSEAALAAGKPLGTVKSRLARARLRLRDCLQGFAELLPASFRLEEESET
jgi:RNA polymerase sigma-70 factor (ECF subfamily)